MSATITYLDNRETLLAILDEVRGHVASGAVSALGFVVCQGVPPYARSVYAALNTTRDRDRLVMGAELLKHQLIMEEEDDGDAAAEEGIDPWGPRRA